MALIQMAVWRCDFCGKKWEGHQREIDYQDWCGHCEIEMTTDKLPSWSAKIGEPPR